MGNSLVRYICGKFCKAGTDEPGSLGAHGVTAANAGVSILARDLFEFDITNKVPEGLSQHVVSSKKAQANWYKKLLDAWRETKPPPKTPDEATRLVVNTLKRHQKADVEGLLAYYGLPLPHTIPAENKVPGYKDGVKYELQTLPVDAKAVSDGDTITVYVDTADPRESANVTPAVHKAAVDRTKARAVKDYKKADALHKVIIDAGYRSQILQNTGMLLHSICIADSCSSVDLHFRVIPGPNNAETLAKKYRIRLRGIDAPESSMPFGKEAKEHLLKLVEGKSLKIYVTGDDRYGRSVGDIYCNGVYIQEQMLKKGFVWHYAAYDNRPELSKWEEEARRARRGLWASSNPEKPWEWRKNKRNGA